MRDDEPVNLERYLEVLAGAAAGVLIEIRYRIPEGMGRQFVASADIPRAAQTVTALAGRSDTFVGVLPRLRRRGRLEDLPDAAALAWVDCDTPASERALRSFRAVPSMIVGSGTGQHCHAYWILREATDLGSLERLNHTLALALGADPGVVTKPHTILRPPGSFNHKHTPAKPVQLLELDTSRRYEASQLIATLELPHPAKPAAGRGCDSERVRRPRPRRDETVYEQLREIPAAEYVSRLTGREPNREGKVLCPFHEERTPSLQTYADGSWCCFGCGRGGSIVDFAAGLWGMGTKGREFLQIRDRLAGELLDAARPAIGQAQATARPFTHRTQTTTTEELAR